MPIKFKTLDAMRAHHSHLQFCDEQLQPISRFKKTDNEDQPALLLLTADGLLFRGEWDPSAGYFFANELAYTVLTPEQIDSVNNMELPGRMYNKPVKFAYMFK